MKRIASKDTVQINENFKCSEQIPHLTRVLYEVSQLHIAVYSHCPSDIHLFSSIDAYVIESLIYIIVVYITFLYATNIPT